MADPQTTPLTANERQALIRQIETVIQTRIAPGGSFIVDGELTLIEQQQYMRAMVEFFHARQRPGDGVTTDGVITDQEKALIMATPQAMILESIDAMQTPETYTDTQLMSLLSAVNNVAGEMERTASASAATTPPPPAPPAPPSAPAAQTITEVLTVAPVITLRPLQMFIPAITPEPAIEEPTPAPGAGPTQNTAPAMTAAPQPTPPAVEGGPFEPARDAAPTQNSAPAMTAADPAAEDRRWLLQHATSNEAVGRAVNSFGNPQADGRLSPGDMYRLQAASPEEITTFMEGLRAQGIAPPREGTAPAAPAAEPQAPAPRDGQTVRDTNWLLQNATRNEAVGRAIDGIGAGGAGHNDGKLTPEDMYRLQAASPEAVAAVMAQLRTQGVTPPQDAAHVSDPARTPVQPLDPHGAIGLAPR